MPLTRSRRQPGVQLRCTVCTRHFTKKEHLQRHERSHTGDKPFSCEACGRSFARRDSLNRHERLHQRTSSAVIPSTDTSPPSSVHRYEIYTEEALLPLSLPNGDFAPPQMTNYDLYWPQSEDVMPIDPALCDRTMTALPLTSTSHVSSPRSYHSDGTGPAGNDDTHLTRFLDPRLNDAFTGNTALTAEDTSTARP